MSRPVLDPRVIALGAAAGAVVAATTATIRPAIAGPTLITLAVVLGAAWWLAAGKLGFGGAIAAGLAVATYLIGGPAIRGPVDTAATSASSWVASKLPGVGASIPVYSPMIAALVASVAALIIVAVFRKRPKAIMWAAAAGVGIIFATATAAGPEIVRSGLDTVHAMFGYFTGGG